MRFFHVYNEKNFDGLVKNNLINSHTGFKLQHCFAMPFDQKFNEIVQPGGKLHNLLKGGEYAFYVDRIAGIKALSEKCLPCTCDNLMWMLSDGEDCTRYLSIFNSEGNDRTPSHGDSISPDADGCTKVTFKESARLKIVKASNADVKLQQLDDKCWCVDVPAASFVILSY